MAAIAMDAPVDFASLSSMTAQSAVIAKVQEVSEVRFAALRETAVGVGARAGLSRRSYEIKSMLDAYAPKLDAIFNFRPLMVEGNVLPPVLVRANQVFNQPSNDVIHIVDRVYTIEAQARFASVAPTWRTYLVQDYPVFASPHVSLLPKMDAEQVIWKSGVSDGWQQGVKQADAIFMTNLNRLKRDIEGMIRYRMLYAKNMVSKPYVATSQMSVTGSNEEININDSVFRITVMPALNKNLEKWRGFNLGVDEE